MSQTAALRPATKLAVRAKDGAEDGDDVDEDDGSSSSDESDEEEAKREELNPHNLKRKLWAEKSRALLGEKVQVKLIRHVLSVPILTQMMIIGD